MSDKKYCVDDFHRFVKASMDLHFANGDFVKKGTRGYVTCINYGRFNIGRFDKEPIEVMFHPSAECEERQGVQVEHLAMDSEKITDWNDHDLYCEWFPVKTYNDKLIREIELALFRKDEGRNGFRPIFMETTGKHLSWKLWDICFKECGLKSDLEKVRELMIEGKHIKAFVLLEKAIMHSNGYLQKAVKEKLDLKRIES